MDFLYMTTQQPTPVTEQTLIQDISAIISQYRFGALAIAYDDAHVTRWINQFAPHERMIVLEETKRLLRQGYLSESTFDSFLDTLKPYFENSRGTAWNNVSLLNIQQNGSSQNVMVNKLSARIYEQYALTTKINDLSANVFIYLDDFIFSGNRVLRDTRDWIANSAPQSCSLVITTIGYFNYGQHYVRRKLNEAIAESGKNIQLNFLKFRGSDSKENRFYLKDNADVFWPMESARHVAGVTEFLATQSRQFSYRAPSTLSNTTFSSSRREAYENIILKYGLQIIGYSQDPSRVLKPLGFDTFEGLGFGATIFTYRNCPNNCPLVFWWGDPSAPAGTTLSRWYPLLQRETYAR